MKEQIKWKDLSKKEIYNLIVGSYNLDYNILVAVDPKEMMETRMFYKGLISGVIRYAFPVEFYGNDYATDLLIDLQNASYAFNWNGVPDSIKNAIKHNVEEYAERRKKGEAFSSEIAVLELYDKYIK